MSGDLITLVTSPGSPTLRIVWKEDSTIGNLDIVDLPDADVEFQGSPVKRQRTYSLRQAKGSVKQFRLNHVKATVPDAFESDLLAPSLLRLGDVNDTDRYPEFVEAALSACLGFYHLTSSIYLVQGWDASTATAT
ncbi:hypothetical protein H0H92_006931, partial [Tricholoma furcatifolium]